MARKTDELDSTLTNIGIFLIVMGILACLFISDWYFGKKYLTPTLIGILIGTPLGWIGSSVNYFFQRKQERKDENEKQ